MASAGSLGTDLKKLGQVARTEEARQQIEGFLE